MDIHNATEQAYRNGYEAGLAENEESVCQLRKNWQDAEMHICTMCGHFDHKTEGNIVYGNKQCGEIVGFPFCGKFTPWIAVTERLPEKEGSYLVCSKTGKVYTSHYYTEKKWSEWYTRKAEWSHPNVTHWMPLPNPPTE